MVKHFYLDASAFAKRYSPEKGSRFVDSLFKEGHALMTAALTYAEVYSAINRIFREGKLTKNQLATLSVLFEEDWAGCGIIDFDAEVRKKIPDCLNRFPLRGSDGVHLASALTVQEKGIDAGLITSDGKLFNAAENCGLKAVDPARLSE